MIDKISKLIGQTPLLKIKSLSEKTGNNILVKCEHLNPGGSIKDRTALGIIQEAVLQNKILQNHSKPTQVIEGTAGNTGIGLALLAHEFNFKAVIVMPNNQSQEKYNVLKSLGAELVTVDPCPFANSNHFYHTAQRLADERAQQGFSTFWVNQFENLANFNIHYKTTGSEIWEQTNGNINAFISSVGTGGTLGGVSKFLKEKNKNIHIRLADPQGSGLHRYLKTGELKAEGSSITEGIGIMRLTENFKKAQIDSSIEVSDQNMMQMFYHLSQTDGLIVGTSAALNIYAAYEYSLEHKNKNLTIVTIICDSGLRYSSKVFNEEFLKSKNFDSLVTLF